jgi:acyl carrier protein
MEYVDAVELVTRLVCSSRRVDVTQIGVADDLGDALGFDSLDAAALVAAIHKETGRELPATSFQDLRTVQSIAMHLTQGSAV